MSGLIAVVGAGSCDSKLAALAEAVGEAIARAGRVLVNGGLGGVMHSSAKGCKKAGGRVVGILPGLDPGEANPFVDIALATGLGEMRNLLIVRAASGIIALGGGYGTLSEIALALKAGKPVVGLGTWDLAPDIKTASTPASALELLLKEISKR